MIDKILNTILHKNILEIENVHYNLTWPGADSRGIISVNKRR